MNIIVTRVQLTRGVTDKLCSVEIFFHLSQIFSSPSTAAPDKRSKDSIILTVVIIIFITHPTLHHLSSNLMMRLLCLSTLFYQREDIHLYLQSFHFIHLMLLYHLVLSSPLSNSFDWCSFRCRISIDSQLDQSRYLSTFSQFLIQNFALSQVIHRLKSEIEQVSKTWGLRLVKIL